jgi:hypothetical protein
LKIDVVLKIICMFLISFLGADYTVNVLNHDFPPGVYALSDLKLNVDTINTNIGTINI